MAGHFSVNIHNHFSTTLVTTKLQSLTELLILQSQEKGLKEYKNHLRSCGSIYLHPINFHQFQTWVDTITNCVSVYLQNRRVWSACRQNLCGGPHREDSLAVQAVRSTPGMFHVTILEACSLCIWTQDVWHSLFLLLFLFVLCREKTEVRQVLWKSAAASSRGKEIPPTSRRARSGQVLVMLVKTLQTREGFIL